MKVCFLTKIEKPGVKEAIDFTKQNVDQLDVFSGSRKEEFPRKLYKHDYDILFSYISPWIVPEETLNQTKKWNINFHPGPPEYPGIGCYNFAIYNKENSFGCTAHLMDTKVDSGKIIGVENFKLLNSDNVESLANRTYKNILKLYKKTLLYIIKYGKIKKTSYKWIKKPYTRVELELLSKIKQ